MEAEIHAKKYFFAKQSALNIDRLQQNLHFCNAGMKFQGNSSKGSRDTGEKVLGFPSEVPNFRSL